MARIRCSDSLIGRMDNGASPLHCASVPPIRLMGMRMQGTVPLGWGSVSGGPGARWSGEVDGLGSPFSGVQTNNYWSSTTNANNTSNAWIVNLNNGNVNNDNKTNSNYVWPVRGGE